MRPFALAFAVLVPLGAAAQEPQIDPQTVRACFETTGPGMVQPPCVGFAAQTCQAQPGGQTTLGISACLQGETQAWDDLLNAQYKGARAQMLAQGGPALADQLLEAQRAWIAFRDADCGLEYSIWGDGSMRVIAAAQCQLRKTAQRVFELRALGG